MVMAGDLVVRVVRLDGGGPAKRGREEEEDGW